MIPAKLCCTPFISIVINKIAFEYQSHNKNKGLVYAPRVNTLVKPHAYCEIQVFNRDNNDSSSDHE